MNAQEHKAAFRKFQALVGPEAWVSVSLTHDVSHNDGAFSCSVYPNGVTHKHGFTVYADDLAELHTKAQEKWAEFSAEFRQQAVRKMALAIIRITADIGQCTDAALRDEFTRREVESYGAEACADANLIAGKGPFEIVTLGGANGAPDKLPEGATVN